LRALLKRAIVSVAPCLAVEASVLMFSTLRRPFREKLGAPD